MAGIDMAPAQWSAARIVKRAPTLALALSMLAATAAAAQAPSSPPSAPADEATIGRIIGPALRSTDLTRSSRFYQDGLGLTFAGRLDLPSVTEFMFAFGTSRQPPVLIVFKGNDAGASAPASATVGYARTVLEVADAQRVYDRLTAAGFKPEGLHINSKTGFKGFTVKDPDGHGFEVTERPSATAKGAAN